MRSVQSTIQEGTYRSVPFRRSVVPFRLRQTVGWCCVYRVSYTSAASSGSRTSPTKFLKPTSRLGESVYNPGFFEYSRVSSCLVTLKTRKKKKGKRRRKKGTPSINIFIVRLVRGKINSIELYGPIVVDD